MIVRERQTAATDPARLGLAPAGDGQMWLDNAFRTRLGRAGLNCFEDVMAGRGRCLRVLQERENWYVPMTGDPPPSAGAYLKKHRIRTWQTRLRASLGAGPGTTAARIEAQHAGSLADLGIAAIHPVAYGEKLHPSGLLESFLLTEELVGYQELDGFLRDRFPPRSLRGGLPRDATLLRLVRQVAEIARRFHAAGYNHRDFYSCHFLVKELAPGRFDVRLIDLQRVQRRRWFRRRWLVKDLAQLAYSAPKDRIGCAEKLVFLRQYFGVRKLGPPEKRLLRAVLRKQRIMAWRLGAE